MITTFSAIARCSLRAAKLAIIGVSLTVLAACSSVKLAYGTGAQLAWWYLDGYLDFNRVQTPQVKQTLQELFTWHRSSQLPEYAAVLADAQQAVLEPTTPAATCRWWQTALDALQPTVNRAVQQAAQLVPTLTEAQFQALEARHAKALQDMREDYLQPDPAERLAESVKRAVKRAEQIYGALDEPQRKLIAAGVAVSPFDPQAWMQERQRRQRDTQQTLRRLAAERLGLEQRAAELRALFERTQRSPDPAYRAYQQRLSEYNCAFAAQLHNATTAAQRKRARERLKAWEDDFRTLASSAAAG